MARHFPAQHEASRRLSAARRKGFRDRSQRPLRPRRSAAAAPADRLGLASAVTAALANRPTSLDRDPDQPRELAARFHPPRRRAAGQRRASRACCRPERAPGGAEGRRSNPALADLARFAAGVLVMLDQQDSPAERRRGVLLKSPRSARAASSCRIATPRRSPARWPRPPPARSTSFRTPGCRGQLRLGARRAGAAGWRAVAWPATRPRRCIADARPVVLKSWGSRGDVRAAWSASTAIRWPASR